MKITTLRAGCVVALAIGLYHMHAPYQTQWMTDNAVGATANAAERTKELVELLIVIVLAAIGLAGSFICERIESLRQPPPPPPPPPAPTAPTSSPTESRADPDAE